MRGNGVLNVHSGTVVLFFNLSKGVLVMKTVSEYFGSLVFDDRVMKATLSAKVYNSLKKTID